MRVAVISDIHANLHALEAVLPAIEEERPDKVWCLGDLVGYGPRPNPCCAKVAAWADLCLVGNHDLGVLGSISLLDFSDEAATSARWTQEVLGAEAHGYLESLESSASVEGAELYHASPRDPVWEYVIDEFTIRAAFADTEAPLVLVGHSHVPIVAELDGDLLSASHAPEGTEVDLGGGRVLLNPGSIGQPRDGDARAAWFMLDFDVGRGFFRRVDYPVERTQEEIRERGLPESLAERLGHGL